MVHNRHRYFLQDAFVCGTMNGSGGYVLSWGNRGLWACGGYIPQGLRNKLKGRQRNLPGVSFVCIGEDDQDYFVSFVDGAYSYCLPRHISNAIQSRGLRPTRVALGPNETYVVVSEDGHVVWDGDVPESLQKLLRNTRNGEVKQISLGQGGTYFVKFSTGECWCHVREPLLSVLRSASAEAIKMVSLSPDSDEYIVVIGNRTLFHTHNKALEDAACDWMDPSDIYYSNTSISPYFQDRGSVYKLADDLKYDKARKLVLRVPKIRVVKVNGRFFTLDNRRLFAFQQARLDFVPVLQVLAIDISTKLARKLVNFKGSGVAVRGPRHDSELTPIDSWSSDRGIKMDDEKRPLLGSGASKTPSDPTLLITHQEIRKVVSAGKLASSSDGGTVTLAEKFIADVRIAKREASYQDVAGLAATGRIPSIQRVNSQTTKQAIFRVGSQSANLGGDGGEGSSGDLLGAESTTVEVERGGDSDPNAWKLDVKVFERYIRNTTAPGFRKHPKKVRDFYRRQNEVIHSFMEVERRFAKYETDVGEVLEESERSDRMATHLSNIFNLLLLIAKVVVAYFSGSLSVISSLIDSAVDMLSGLVLWFAAMRIDDHNPYLYPIGRQQLEPLSIVILATVMAVASVEVIRESVNSLVTNEIEVTFDLLSTAIMGATIVIKLALWTYCKTISTPTGQALSLDHFNDIVSNIGAVIFAWGAVRLWKPLDPIGAILMALYIIFSWFKTGREEIQGLSGRSASPDFLKTMTWIARNHHPYIMAVETVTAYHVGAKLLAEVDIVLDPETPLPVAHDIAETLQLKYEDLEEIERAFVHIDFELVHDRRFEHARHL